VKIPNVLVQGDSLTWKDCSTWDNARNPITSDIWTLTYVIRGPSVLDLTAGADGSGWATSITSSQSSGLTPGAYFWQAFATNAQQRITLGSGQLTVEANLSSQTAPYDGRSQTQKDLEAVQAAMRAIVTGGGVQRYSIGNRSVEKMSMADLIAIESKLKYRLALERRKESIENGNGDPTKLLVRF
jgi:hypothetical protein